jgi:hypothetical protein
MIACPGLLLLAGFLPSNSSGLKLAAGANASFVWTSEGNKTGAASSESPRLVTARVYQSDF